jgi:hypothetical protein
MLITNIVKQKKRFANRLKIPFDSPFLNNFLVSPVAAWFLYSLGTPVICFSLKCPPCSHICNLPNKVGGGGGKGGIDGGKGMGILYMTCITVRVQAF